MYQLHHADAFAVLNQLPDHAVHAVVTDPPYGTGGWARPTTALGKDPRAVHVRHTWDVWSTAWLDDAWRVSGGHVGLFCPAVQLPSLMAWVGDRPYRLFQWIKSDPRPRFSGQPAYGFEGFVVVGPVQPIGGKDYMVASAPRKNRDREAVGHPHQKPSGVMDWCVNLTCPEGGTVLDPFMGSGTTGVSSLRTGRTLVGVERDEAYFGMAGDRLAAFTDGGSQAGQKKGG